MKNQKTIVLRTATSFFLAAIFVVPLADLILPLPSRAQSRNREKNAQEQGKQKSYPARRDEVQTQNVPLRLQNPTPSVRKGDFRITNDIRAQRDFTKTVQGRRYDNGMVLRPATTILLSWQKPYFPRGYTYYPNYRTRNDAYANYISPFSFYFGVIPSFISQDWGYDRRPDISYLENGNSSWAEIEMHAINYFEDRNINKREPGLMNAIDELSEAFEHSNIDALVAVTDPYTEISIYFKDKYSYSMNSNDFLDLTRDTLTAVRTVAFDLTLLDKKAEGVYVVSGKHLYRDKQNRSRTVYVSYVLESLRDHWTLTQFGTAPDRVHRGAKL